MILAENLSGFYKAKSWMSQKNSKKWKITTFYSRVYLRRSTLYVKNFTAFHFTF